jgi:uncharacterized membrane protein YozB (DUF420 family)
MMRIHNAEPGRLLPVLRWGIVLLILKVTVSIVQGYRDYFPANFEAGFLRGREAHFFGAYRAAFYAHIASGPVSLVLGLVLISQWFRMRFTSWHRALGKVQGLLVLLVLAPSGLWMAQHAETGTVAAIGFAMLAIITAGSVVIGWRAAVQKRFVVHRAWMLRCFFLLCSAVVLRVIGGLATVTGIGSEWSYPAAAWLSWLVPLALFELTEGFKRRRSRANKFSTSASDLPLYSSPLTTSSSPPAIEIIARR